MYQIRREKYRGKSGFLLVDSGRGGIFDIEKNRLENIREAYKLNDTGLISRDKVKDVISAELLRGRL
jgi:hypothetical protein